MFKFPAATPARVSRYVYTGFEIGASNTFARTSPIQAAFAGVLVGGQRSANRVIWSAASGIKRTRAFSIYGGITHFITPPYEFDFTAGYMHQDNSGTGVARCPTTQGCSATGNASHFGQYEFEAQLQSKPIPTVRSRPIPFRAAAFSRGTSANYGLATRDATTIDFGL